MNLKKPGLCHAGSRYIYVAPEGTVLACRARSRPLGDLSVSPRLQLSRKPRQCPVEACQCDTDNVNTVQFEKNYVRVGRNQHRYRYRFAAEADEWNLPY